MIYIVNEYADLVVEGENGYDVNGKLDFDKVKSSIGYMLPNNLEALELTGKEAIDGTGNDLDNYIQGNAKTNILTGGAGDDHLVGGGWYFQQNIRAYNISTKDANTLAGGLGDDTYLWDLNETIIERPGEGSDTVRVVNQNFNLAIANVENIDVFGLGKKMEIGGDDQANKIDVYGSILKTTINAKGGNDTIAFYDEVVNSIVDAGDGNDYIVSDANTDDDVFLEKSTILGGRDKDTIVLTVASGSYNHEEGNKIDGGLGADKYILKIGDNYPGYSHYQVNEIMPGGFVSNLDNMIQPEEDIIDLKALFEPNTVTASNISQFIRMNGNTLQIDTDGGGDSFKDLLIIRDTNITTMNLDELYTAGQIIA